MSEALVLCDACERDVSPGGCLAEEEFAGGAKPDARHRGQCWGGRYPDEPGERDEPLVLSDELAAAARARGRARLRLAHEQLSLLGGGEA